jgi:L-ascorbate metabolism protein UlaG (beta-lactamase superfamily)
VNQKIKPFKHGKRFYNHSDESVFSKIIELVKVSGWLFAKKYILNERRRSKCYRKENIASWVETFSPEPSSIKPVITWLGHATFLIQIGGANIITDPILFDLSKVIRRTMPLPLKPENLPKIDFILISHNHYDHLNKRSLNFLAKDNPVILAPLGTRCFFRKNKGRVFEKNWYDKETIKPKRHGVNAISFEFLPAHHWSGRGITNFNSSLWGSWMIEYEGFKIYFAGDTAYSDHFKQIRSRNEKIDVALMPIGPTEPEHLMKLSHINEVEALEAFLELGAKTFIPMHWGTFPFGTDLHFDTPIKKFQKVWDDEVSKHSDKEVLIVKAGQQCKF